MAYIYIHIRGIIVYYILEINKHMNLITFQPHNYYEHGHIISIKLKSKFMSVHIHFMEYERAGYVWGGGGGGGRMRRIKDERIIYIISH